MSLSTRAASDLAETLAAALEQVKEGKGDPLFLIESAIDTIKESKYSSPAVKRFTEEIIEAEPWRSGRGFRDEFGTSVLNYVYDHAWEGLFVEAFEDVRETPHMAAWVMSMAEGPTYGGPSMLHDLAKASDGGEEGTHLHNTLHLAFAQYMVGVVQVALGDRIMVLDKGQKPTYAGRA